MSSSTASDGVLNWLASINLDPILEPVAKVLGAILGNKFVGKMLEGLMSSNLVQSLLSMGGRMIPPVVRIVAPFEDIIIRVMRSMPGLREALLIILYKLNPVIKAAMTPGIMRVTARLLKPSGIIEDAFPVLMGIGPLLDPLSDPAVIENLGRINL
ncbi:MAG: hypothetical protein MOIL_00624 [Candidatus Methanolliviera sp. GoM_oil]|nr:MAG: hypothetical protein MOIL_00624 [Candidatus Methanolliviera sp. GoM_oil]